MKKSLCASLLLFTVSMHANSAVIKAEASGPDSGLANFWGVSFDNGSGFIKTVEFDLTPLSSLNISFDFDGATVPRLNAPVIGTKSGLTDQDISADFTGTTPKLLSFSFTSGSFEMGDSFMFRADTDGFSSPVPGDLHGFTSPGISGLLLTVTMEDGAMGSGNFIVPNPGDNTSSVVISVTPSAVPIPAALWLFGSSLILMRLRKNK